MKTIKEGFPQRVDWMIDETDDIKDRSVLEWQLILFPK